MSHKRKKPSRNPAKVNHTHDEANALWIRTEPTIDGTGWMVTLEIDEDHSISLDRAAAMEAAYAILGAAAHADYDASVLRQITKKINRESALQLIIDMRKDRPELDMSALAPLLLTPGVNLKGEPFITVQIGVEPVGQWDLPEARKHAMALLESQVVADLDAGYLRCLKGVVGLEDNIARSVVGDLAEHR